MTRQKFDRLVERIEARYRGRPAALERSTATWVVLGLLGFVSWVGFLLLLGLSFFGGGIVLEPPGSLWLLGFGAVLIVYGIMQAGLFLLVDLGLPKGRPLKPSEATALWRQLDSLGRDLQCRPLGGVFLSMEFNASVREIPRLGLLGWPRTYLEIGFPLSLAVAPDELRAILAHEFAHLSARHGKSGGRIYRIHRTWAEVFQRMQQPGERSFGRATRWATAKFIEWYWPRLHARAFVLSRAQEYQADRIAAEIAGALTLTSAL
jgi:Peptidase family M48